MRTRINKILTMDKFINEALYNKRLGYYMNKNPFGEKGDYITSPNISILFSEMIAIWTISFWENLSCPKKFNLIELGGGNGEMIKQMLSTFEKFPSFNNCCKINIFEKSEYLKKIQKKKLKNKKVKWLRNLNEISSLPSIFIANEFFDALPIKQFFKKDEKWYERSIKFSKLSKPRFLDILINIKKVEKKIGFKISNNQKIIEFSPLAFEYIKIISKKINTKNGGLLILDYGNQEDHMLDTLQSVKNHKFGNILKNIGNSDITYKINFKLLEKIFRNFNLKASNITNQKKFLVNLGILSRAEIISKNLPFSKKANIYYRLKRLIDEKYMGNLFKVMLATKKNTYFNVGFEN